MINLTEKSANNPSSDSEEMLERSIVYISNDGILDVQELESIVQIAMRDGTMDDAEKAVLINVISNLTTADLSRDLWDKIEKLIRDFDLDNPA